MARRASGWAPVAGARSTRSARGRSWSLNLSSSMSIQSPGGRRSRTAGARCGDNGDVTTAAGLPTSQARLAGLARLSVAVALAAAIPEVRPLPIGGALAVFLVAYALIAGWRALAVAAWRRAALEWGDVAVAAGAASVVAAVASPTLVP